MFEVLMLFLVMMFFAACAFAPLGYAMMFFSKLSKQPGVINKSAKQPAPSLKLPEDSTLKRHFLKHLQSEIEDALSPRPTDSVLQRHYDSLVAAELENRLVTI
jgi:hypothetical protein